MASPAPSVVHCPLCELPCRAAAVICDGCGQALHTPLNLDELRDELSVRARTILLALLVIFAMIALNIAFFGGAAYVLASAPLAWLLWSWSRYRALKQKLNRANLQR